MTDELNNEDLTEPAFPLSDERLPSHSGMTLRDWFAGQALSGFMSAKPMMFDPEQDAKYFYDLADAMLAARKK